MIKTWISCAVASKVRRFRILPMPRKWKWVDLQIPLIWSWKVRYWSKITPRSRTLEDGDTCISPTRTDKSLQFCSKSGDRKIINSVLESFILIYFWSSTLEYQKYTMFNFLCQWFQRILTLKWNVELGVIRVNVIANIMVSKYRTKWKQIQTKFHWSQNWALWHPTQQTSKIRHNTINLNSLCTITKIWPN